MGHDLADSPHEVRGSIAMTGQFASLDEDLTGRENLLLLARLWGFRGRAAKARADELLAAFDLSDAAQKQVKTYSGGMRRRLDIAASLVVTPGVLFLDEPTTGLDPNARQGVWRMIRALADAGVTILLTTQYLEEADQLAARIAVIDKGRKIAEGTSRELKAATGSGFLHVALADPARLDEAAQNVWNPGLAEASSGTRKAHSFPLMTGSPRAANEALAALIAADIALGRFLDGLAEPGGGLLRADRHRRGAHPRGESGVSDITGDARVSPLAAGLKAVARPPAPSPFSNALVFGWRAILKFKHVPEQLFDLVMTPIMFTLLFTFVFGGALAGSPREYLQFFLPGILVQTVCFNAVYSGMGLSTDLGKGLFDRFRSLPIWSLAPFAGLMVGDVLRHLIAGAIILTIGLVLGYRPEAGIPGVLAAFALLVAIGFGMGWIFIVLGPPDQHADDGDDAGLHLPVPAGLRLQHHGAAGDDAGLAAGPSWTSTRCR